MVRTRQMSQLLVRQRFTETVCDDARTNHGHGLGLGIAGLRASRNRGTVDGAIRLDIRALRRMGALNPGAVTLGMVRWT
jgi:hypothetical protein